MFLTINYSHRFCVCLLLLLSPAVACSTEAAQSGVSDEIPTTVSTESRQQQGQQEEQESDQKRQEAVEKKPDPASGELESVDDKSDDPADVDLATQLKKEQAEFAKQTIEIPDSWKRMSKTSHIWADKEKKRVVVRGVICLREGLLEMFACPRGTKEHESIVSVHAKSSEMHATLIALGIDPGKPMDWRGEYQPASGPIIDVEVWWTEDSKLKKRRMQEMLKETKTGKATTAKFVFGGSEIYVDPSTKTQTYYADSGEMINVANSPYAMIDVTIKSSMEAEQGLMFAALTENIPPVNTKVYLVLSASGHTDDMGKTEPKKAESKADSDSEKKEAGK